MRCILAVITCCMLASSLMAVPVFDVQAQAQRRPHLSDGTETRKGSFIDKLRLTPEQRRKMTAIRERQKELKSNARYIEQEKQVFREMIRDQEASKEKTLEQFDRVRNLTAENQRRRLENVLSLKEVLTPQQFQAVLDLLQRQRQRPRKY